MSNFSNIKAKINSWIRYNNNKEITGSKLNTILIEMIDGVTGYQYKGKATSSSTPTLGDGNVFYLAVNTLNSPVTYTNYGGLVVAAKTMSFLKYDGSWTKDDIELPSGITIDEVLAVTDTMYLSKLENDTASGRINFTKGVSASDDGTNESFHGQSIYGTELYIGGNTSIDGDANIGGNTSVDGDASVGGESKSEGARVHFDTIDPTDIGWGIRPDGRASFRSLTLRDFMMVPELRLNRISVMSGVAWLAPGAGKVKDVWYHASNAAYVIELDLLEGEYGSFRLNDLCLGIFHTGIEGLDATDTVDDFCTDDPDLSVKGFMTSYFSVIKVYTSSDHLVDRSGETLTPTDDGRYVKIQNRAGYVNYYPRTGSTIVAFGNTSDTTRQSSVYMTTNYFHWLRGADSWDLSHSLAWECTKDGEIIAHNSGSVKITSDNGSDGYWQITGGEIAHVKNGTKGLRMSADGKLYDPDGLSIKVGASQTTMVEIQDAVSGVVTDVDGLKDGRFLIWQSSETAPTTSGDAVAWIDYSDETVSASWTASEREEHVNDFLIYSDGITYKFVKDTTKAQPYGWQILTDKYLIDTVNGLNAVKSGLLATGIDIGNRKITATADTFEIQNNEGKKTLSLDDNGNMFIKGTYSNPMTVIDSTNFSTYHNEGVTQELEGHGGSFTFGLDVMMCNECVVYQQGIPNNHIAIPSIYMGGYVTSTGSVQGGLLYVRTMTRYTDEGISDDAAYITIEQLKSILHKKITIYNKTGNDLYILRGVRLSPNSTTDNDDIYNGSVECETVDLANPYSENLNCILTLQQNQVVTFELSQAYSDEDYECLIWKNSSAWSGLENHITENQEGTWEINV